MITERVNAWTGAEDKILVDTILDYVRQGKRQLQAFEDVGGKLDRTAHACGFRWNKYLRKDFQEDLRLARREYRQQKIDAPKFEKPNSAPVVVKALTVETLEVKEFKNQRVVTFKDIDEVHGRPEGTARKRFADNKERFIEGEDFFLVKPNDSEVRKTDIREVVNNAGTIFLTESGYLMLVKSFTDDLAWEVQRKLVKTYFRVKDALSQPVHSYIIEDPIERAKAWIREQEEKKRLETQKLLLEQQVADLAPKISYMDTILKSTDSIIVSQISADYGISAKALNKILHEEGIQYKRNDQWLLYSEHTGQGYTESRTIPYTKTNGEQGSSIQTRWTQKGRLFIHNILTKRGITPLMDR